MRHQHCNFFRSLFIYWKKDITTLESSFNTIIAQPYTTINPPPKSNQTQFIIYLFSNPWFNSLHFLLRTKLEPSSPQHQSNPYWPPIQNPHCNNLVTHLPSRACSLINKKNRPLKNIEPKKEPLERTCSKEKKQRNNIRGIDEGKDHCPKHQKTPPTHTAIIASSITSLILN